jgi:hypothetical protein
MINTLTKGLMNAKSMQEEWIGFFYSIDIEDALI